MSGYSGYSGATGVSGYSGATGGGSTAVTFFSMNDLVLWGASGSYFKSTISGNQSFYLSGISSGVYYYTLIKNTSASAVTITLPNTADIKPSATFTVGANNKYKEVALIYDGTTRIWQVSEELSF